MGLRVNLVFISTILVAMSFTIPTNVNTTFVLVPSATEMLQIPNNASDIVLPANESIEEVESGSIAGFKLIPKPGR